uniref:Uncharacterized protein n=1 Tax=Mycena chlorophos TaxID=658473 RepID=A0ABQ0L8F8_MYCCL|nr:predicted protein [Mycena chlorophos]
MTAAAGIKAYSERRLLFSSDHHHPAQLDRILHNQVSCPPRRRLRPPAHLVRVAAHPPTMVANKKTPAKAAGARTSTPSSSSSDASTKKKKRSAGRRKQKPTEYNKFFVRPFLLFLSPSTLMTLQAAQMALLKATIEDNEERRRIISKRWAEKKAEDATNAPGPASDSDD